MMAHAWLTTLGMVLGWLGALVIALALVVVPMIGLKRRRRRCPKCWYDLSHSPGMVCSECGFVAKRERQLRKGRRHYRWAAVGLAIIMAGYGLHCTPEVRQRGWPAAVPTSVLILMLPLLRPSVAVSGPDVQHDWLPLIVTANGPNTWHDRLYAELYHERVDEQMRGPHNWLLHRMCLVLLGEKETYPSPWRWRQGMLLAATRWEGGRRFTWNVPPPRDDDMVTVTTRSVWPRGETVWGKIIVGRSNDDIRFTAKPMSGNPGRPWQGWVMTRFPPGTPFDVMDDERHSLLPLGIASRNGHAVPLKFDLFVQEFTESWPISVDRWELIQRRELEVSFDVVDSIEEAITPVCEEELDDAISSYLSSTQLWQSFTESNAIIYQLIVPRYEPNAITLTGYRGVCIAFHAEVIHNGITVAEARTWLGSPDFRRFSMLDTLRAAYEGNFLPIDILDEDQFHIGMREGALRLRLTGCGRTALRNIDAERYWDGQIEMPLPRR